jgi:hypothetical protein
MYDWPEVAWANDALWLGICERLREAGMTAPDRLDRARPAEHVWRDPGLVLSQTCGLPFSTLLRGAVRFVATPVYAVAGCEGPLYSSVIVAPLEAPGNSLSDFSGRRIAYNARGSLSGYVALREALSSRPAAIAPQSTPWLIASPISRPSTPFAGRSQAGISPTRCRV